jgi:hypothetical protein
MIPVNDAILVAVVAVALAAAAVALVARAYWRQRAEDAYQDGHAAGIQTQIGRHYRALRRQPPADSGSLPAVMRGRHRALTAAPESDVTVADVTTAAAARPGPALPVVVPFPEGLPPDLRKFAQASLEAADKYKWGMLP